MITSLADKLQDLHLTESETIALTSIIGNLYAEEGYSDIDVNDISRDTNIPTKSLRGTLSSLVKKGIIILDENDSKYVIIYLAEQFWYLHPTWSILEN